jgi:hypothetical protein
MIIKAIKYILENDAPLQLLISGKVYPVVVPQEIALPFIVYSLNSTNPYPSKVEESDKDADQISITCYADDYDEAMDLAEAVRDALDKVTPSTYNGTELSSCDFVSWRDGFNQSVGANGSFLFTVEFEAYN